MDQTWNWQMKAPRSLVLRVWFVIGVNQASAWGIPEVNRKMEESHYVSLMIYAMTRWI